MSMSEAVAVAAVWLALVGGTAGLLARRVSAGLPKRSTGSFLSRTRTVADQSVRSLGRSMTAGVVLGAGLACTITVCWILGRGAKLLEGSLDRPAFSFFEGHQTHWLVSASRLLTQMGNSTPTRLLTVVAALVFALLWRKGRWWAPPVTLLVGIAMERFGAELLRLVVHRGHPPTTLGTWPSGGCARLILVYGLVVFFYQRWRGRGITPGSAWLWAGLALLASIEAFTRVYLLEHWLTDAVGGLVFGFLLLLTMMASFAVLDRPLDGRAVENWEETTMRPPNCLC